jgi:hypothetical protein
MVEMGKIEKVSDNFWLTFCGEKGIFLWLAQMDYSLRRTLINNLRGWQVLGLRAGEVKSFLEKFAAMNPTYRWVGCFVSLHLRFGYRFGISTSDIFFEDSSVVLISDLVCLSD